MSGVRVHQRLPQRSGDGLGPLQEWENLSSSVFSLVTDRSSSRLVVVIEKKHRSLGRVLPLRFTSDSHPFPRS